MRLHSKNKILLLTDGNFNIGGDPKDVAEQMYQCKGAMKISIYALGIGNSITTQRLKYLFRVSKGDKILANYFYQDFVEFTEAVNLVAAVQ